MKNKQTTNFKVSALNWYFKQVYTVCTVYTMYQKQREPHIDSKGAVSLSNLNKIKQSVKTSFFVAKKKSFPNFEFPKTASLLTL